MKKKLATLLGVLVFTIFTSISAFASSVYPEIEPNDTKEISQQLINNTQTLLQFSNSDSQGRHIVKANLSTSQDVDWYKIGLIPSSTNYLAINYTTGASTNQTRIEFYKSDGTLLSTFNFTGKGLSTFRLQTDAAENYYIKVSSESWTGNLTYGMQIGTPTYSGAYAEKQFPAGPIKPSLPWTGSFDLTSDSTIPQNALCDFIVSNYVLQAHYTDMYYQNASTTWRKLPLGGMDIAATNMNKARQKWEIKYTPSSKDTTISPELSLYYVYPVLPPEEMIY